MPAPGASSASPSTSPTSSTWWTGTAWRRASTRSTPADPGITWRRLLRPLLSTRLFDSVPLRGRELVLARRRGFSGLEIFAGRHLDILDPRAGAFLRTMVKQAGLGAQWLYLPPPALGRLQDELSRDS